MREYKSLVIALIAAVSAVACVSIFTGGLLDYKRGKRNHGHRVSKL